MSQPQTTWVLVADARRARLFRFTNPRGSWTPVEDIPGEDPGELAHDLGSKDFKNFHSYNDPKENRERQFAHRLVKRLEQGLAANAFSYFVLVAPAKLLGDLRELLSASLVPKLLAAVSKEYDHLNAQELQSRLGPELFPPPQ